MFNRKKLWGSKNPKKSLLENLKLTTGKFTSSAKSISFEVINYKRYKKVLGINRP